MLTVYRIVKTLFYEDPEIQPSTDAVKRFFQHKNSADQKAVMLALGEAEELNQGEAEGTFEVSAMDNEHTAVVEFWEGEETEGSRDKRDVTYYDVFKLEKKENFRWRYRCYIISNEKCSDAFEVYNRIDGKTIMTFTDLDSALDFVDTVCLAKGIHKN